MALTTQAGQPVRLFTDRQHRLVAPKFGLLSVADLPTDTDPHWAAAGLEYWPPVVPAVGATEIECLGEGEFTPREIPEGFPAGVADPFQVHAAARCKAVGISLDELRARALASLGAAEVPFVEDRLWTTTTPAIMSADTETVVATAASIDKAVGQLEAWLYTEYASVGVIHMPRELGAIADHLSIVSADGNVMRTKLGTPVVFGNYPGTGPADQVPAAGQTWIAATGDVTVWRTAPEVLTDSGSAWFDPLTNTGTAIVTRDYMVTFDEVAGAALVAL